MKWLIYGDIAEQHVVNSFCDSLNENDIQIIRLPALNRSHQFITDLNEEKQIENSLREVLYSHNIDVLFNFRVSQLTARHIELLKNKNIYTFAWLPDDPLLYQICYKHIVNLYDVVLHCGYADVIEFYQRRHGVQNGFCFPFWSSEKYFPYIYNLNATQYDVGFLGNCHTINRKGRYELLANLPFKTVFFGRPPKEGNYTDIWGGYIHNETDIPEHLQKLKLAISVPQFFADAKDTIYSFPDLSLFESFYFPSRIVQYAACGIPTIIKNTQYAKNILSSLLVYENNEDLLEMINEHLSCPKKLLEISKAIHGDFRKYLSARSRVEMLITLMKNACNYTLWDRVNLWRNFPIMKQVKSSVTAQEPFP